MKEKVTSLSSVIKQVVAVLVIGLSVGYALAWDDPPMGIPPACDDPNIVGCNPPINVADSLQQKLGSLGIAKAFSVGGAVQFSMNQLLPGAVGKPAENKVLTAIDDTGKAEWRDSTGGGGAGTYYVKSSILNQDRSQTLTIERCTYQGYMDLSHPCTTVDCDIRSSSFGTCRDSVVTGRKVSYAQVMCDGDDVAVSASYLNIANGGRTSGLIPIVEGGKPVGYECQDISFKGGTCYVTCRK